MRQAQLSKLLPTNLIGNCIGSPIFAPNGRARPTWLSSPWIRSRWFTALALALMALLGPVQAGEVEIVLADKGKSKLPIVIS
jgi:hypothetical protein